MNKRSVSILTAMCAAAILMMTLAACDSNNIKTVDAGSIWEVGEVTTLTGLIIGEGAVIKAPEGYSLTMTVDGVETPIEAGEYKGKIVLTPTENIPVFYSGSGINETYNLRTGIYIYNGAYVREKSVASAVTAGIMEDASAKDVSIASIGECFNGFIAAGDTTYTYSLINPVISLTGNGGNDFAGYGAALMSDGKAELVVENARIINNGCIRGAVWVGGDSTTRINNSYIEVRDGTLPEVFKVPAFMMEVPWMLGLTGNNRATLVVGNGTAYYTNSHIKAQGWGVLSTDAVQEVMLYAEDCYVETVESGYGAYADGDSVDTFSGCRFDVNDYALIMTGGDGVFTDGCTVNSDRFGVMMHSLGSGTLTIDKGSVFNTGGPVIQVKTAYPTIIVDNAELNSGSGIILQAMVNDDLNATGGPGGMEVAGDTGMSRNEQGRGEALPQGGMPDGTGREGEGPGGPGDGANAPGGMGGAPPGGADQGMPPQSGMPAGTGGMPGAGGPGGGNRSGNVTAGFSNTTLKGDIVTSMTTFGDVVVTFNETSITGAITTATVKTKAEIDGVSLSKETYYYIGEVINTYCETDDEYGIKVSLKGNSMWTVDKTSYITGLTIARGSTVKAPEGYRVTMSVDGIERPIAAGEYKGRIVLTVAKAV